MSGAKILVAGATGRIGRAVGAELAAAGVAFRGLVRDLGRARDLATTDLAVGDLRDAASLGRALAGIDAALLVCADDPQQAELEIRFIDAARAAGVKRVVKISALVAGVDPPTGFGVAHRRSERALEASCPGYTVLRPAFFFQQIAASFGPDIARGRLIAPAGSGRVAFVDLRDVATVAAKILVEGGHDGRTYALTGPSALSFAEVAERYAGKLGRPVRHLSPPRFVARLVLPLVSDLDWWSAGMVVTLMASIAAGDEAAVRPDLPALLGRAPRSFDEFLAAA